MSVNNFVGIKKRAAFLIDKKLAVVIIHRNKK